MDTPYGLSVPGRFVGRSRSEQYRSANREAGKAATQPSGSSRPIAHPLKAAHEMFKNVAAWQASVQAANINAKKADTQAVAYSIVFLTGCRSRD